MAGKGGGAWKVAYADFVTAMMAFFMVMWLTSQNKPMKESIAQYFRDPYGTGRGGGRSASGTAREGSKSIGPLQSGRGPGRGLSKGSFMAPPNTDPTSTASTRPSLFVLHNGNDARTGTVILFPEASAELEQAAQDRLDELIPRLSGKSNKIEVRGHASRRPLPAESGFADAWALCYARCIATMKYLEAGGIDPARLRLSLAGDSEPYSLRVEPEWQVHNSRVEIYTLSEFVEDLQGTHEERAALSGINGSEADAHEDHAADHSDDRHGSPNAASGHSTSSGHSDGHH